MALLWVNPVIYIFFHLGPFKLISACKLGAIKQKILKSRHLRNPECGRNKSKTIQAWWRRNKGRPQAGAKKSQEQKEHPISKDAGWRPRRKDPAQPSSPVSCQSHAAKGLSSTGKLATRPLAIWGGVLCSQQDCQDVWGLPSGKERQLSDWPPAVPALVPFRGHLGPCTPGSPALVGTLAYKTVWPTPIWLGKPLGEWSRSWLDLDSRHDCKAELGGRDERAWDQRGVDNEKGEEPSERGDLEFTRRTNTMSEKRLAPLMERRPQGQSNSSQKRRGDLGRLLSQSELREWAGSLVPRETRERDWGGYSWL